MPNGTRKGTAVFGAAYAGERSAYEPVVRRTDTLLTLTAIPYPAPVATAPAAPTTQTASPVPPASVEVLVEEAADTSAQATNVLTPAEGS